jgi:hypothetical protein
MGTLTNDFLFRIFVFRASDNNNFMAYLSQNEFSKRSYNREFDVLKLFPRQ